MVHAEGAWFTASAARSRSRQGRFSQTPLKASAGNFVSASKRKQITIRSHQKLISCHVQMYNDVYHAWAKSCHLRRMVQPVASEDNPGYGRSGPWRFERHRSQPALIQCPGRRGIGCTGVIPGWNTSWATERGSTCVPVGSWSHWLLTLP